MLKFTDINHTYESIIPDDIRWVGVTTLTGSVKTPFKREEQALKSSKNRNSKWYTVPPAEILQAWDAEAQRASILGHWYHDKREKDMWSQGIIDGLRVILPVMEQDIKLAPNQTLHDGIYPEHLVYLKSAGICGQADVVKVHDGVVDISDYKTSKEITTAGYTNWEGVTKKMLVPLNHLDDCHLTHYSLQMSVYMYIILRHNPSLKPGRMHVDHIKFVKAGEDKWGYPLYYQDDTGNPIVESIQEIEVPYLRDAVLSLINYIQNPDNCNKIINKA